MPSSPGRNGDSHTSTSWRRPSNGGQPQDQTPERFSMPSSPGRNGDSHTSTSWRRPSNGGQPQDPTPERFHQPHSRPASTRSHCIGESGPTGPTSKPPTTPPTSSSARAAPYPATTRTPRVATTLRPAGAVVERSSHSSKPRRSRRPSNSADPAALGAWYRDCLGRL